eukprot:m.109318 g.109318  ORF g.109318 m.109318 type:complete len:156 (-) comp13998_c0_seq4:129-596(-)
MVCWGNACFVIVFFNKQSGLRDHGLYDKLNTFCHFMKVVKDALSRRVTLKNVKFEDASPVGAAYKDGFRCIEVELQERQDVRIERSGTLARMQTKEIKGEKYNVLCQCTEVVPNKGGRCKAHMRQALAEAFTKLEKDYEEKFKKVFAWQKGNMTN